MFILLTIYLLIFKYILMFDKKITDFIHVNKNSRIIIILTK